MKMMLAENIRAFRKERLLTQEQLAEALGVTAMDGISLAVSQFENEEFTAFWNSIEKEGKNHRG